MIVANYEKMRGMKAPIFVRPLTESECDTLRAGLRLFEALWRVLFECFLFLRSQLLSGRWEVMLDNRDWSKLLYTFVVTELPTG